MWEKQDLSTQAIRLRVGEWGWIAGILAFLYVAFPMAWNRYESFEFTEDYRVPYALSHDYWHLERIWKKAGQTRATLVVGDSVVWGEYVSPEQTLSSRMQEISGKPFLNLGIHGIHPASLAGWIQYHGKSLTGRRVLLHFNPLWMSSARHDLSETKEARFNHPRLIPQFFPAVPSYRESLDNKIGIVVQRFFWPGRWLEHLSFVYFEGMDLNDWIREHPYENPLSRPSEALPAPQREPRHAHQPWFESGMAPASFEWVHPGRSLQWRLFRRSARLLKKRGNEVYVVLGPFNEHMIAEEAMEGYETIVSEACSWLEKEGIHHVRVSLLPSELYGDASHPLPRGYDLMAREVLDLTLDVGRKNEGRNANEQEGKSSSEGEQDVD